MPAVQEHAAGGDQGPALQEGGWADRIRVPCLLLRDERDLAPRKGGVTIGDKQGRGIPSSRPREAEQLAERTNNSVIKEQALKIAEQWQYMADYEEKRWGR